MAAHQQEDLPQVARFVAVMTDTTTLRESLAEFYREQLPLDTPTQCRTGRPFPSLSCCARCGAFVSPTTAPTSTPCSPGCPAPST